MVRSSIGLVALSTVLAACGGSGRGPIAHPSPRRWLGVDAASRTARISLVTAYNASYSGFNIDGAVKGALLFAVPVGWKVSIHCLNRANRRYSCLVAPSPGSSRPPAGAEVPHPVGGLAQGASTTFSFTAKAPALYRLVVVTGGLQPAGMWVVLHVTRGGRPYAEWLR